MDRQVLCGLVVHSQLDLHQRRPASPGLPPDVRVRGGEPVPARLPAPEGEVLASLDGEAGRAFSAVRRPDGSYLLRFHGTCDVALSADLSDVVVSRAKEAAPGVESVLTVGAMLAFQLYLRGLLVLHASAVDLGGACIAFAGASGMGKSTVAALMCAAGARLVTDDVLRVDDPGSSPRARLGATEIRLRKNALALLAQFDDPPEVRTSADERHVLRLRDDADDELPLRAVVVPRPDRGRSSVSLERVPGKQALFSLLGFPRLPGWQDRAVLRDQFAATAALVERVPVLVARIPWGPPFPPSLARQLRDAVDPYLPGSTGS